MKIVRIVLIVLLALLLCAGLGAADFALAWGSPLAWLVAPLTVLGAAGRPPVLRPVCIPRPGVRGRAPPSSLPR